MKISPQEYELNVNLGPSKFSADGFMGDNSFSIDEIILIDKKKIKSLGVTAENLAKRLELTHIKAQEVFGARLEIKADIYATFFESRGRIPSPFQGHGVFEKGETVLLNLVNGKKIVITQLGIAMIRSYSFFQAPKSYYRIDPELVVEMLDDLD